MARRIASMHVEMVVGMDDVDGGDSLSMEVGVWSPLDILDGVVEVKLDDHALAMRDIERVIHQLRRRLRKRVADLEADEKVADDLQTLGTDPDC